MTIPTPPDIYQQLRDNPPGGQIKDSGLAIASLITGVVSWILVPVLGALAAIITGHLAFKEINESNGMLSGKGMATAGLILGYIQLGFVVLLLIAAIVALIFFVPSISNLYRW